MKYSREEFFALANKLPRKEVSYWIKEDYKAIEEMLQANLISPDFAEAEFARLSEELLEESKEV